MAEVIFAVFDDSLIHLKCVRMNDTVYQGESRTRLEACDTAASNSSVMIKTSQEPEPTLTRLILESGSPIYLWRTSMCMYHRRTRKWIHILDSNCLNQIPGEFTYREDCISKFFSGSRNIRCKILHRRMLQTIYRQELTLVRMPAPVPVPLPSEAAPKIPAFLGAIIKRDAITKKDTCPISLEEFTEDMKTVVTPCFHIFTQAGLSRWLESKSLCPTCKTSIATASCLFI